MATPGIQLVAWNALMRSIEGMVDALYAVSQLAKLCAITSDDLLSKTLIEEHHIVEDLSMCV
jgi:hypothetical protein